MDDLEPNLLACHAMHRFIALGNLFIDFAPISFLFVISREQLSLDHIHIYIHIYIEVCMYKVLHVSEGVVAFNFFVNFQTVKK